jgi:hypothetical protein
VGCPWHEELGLVPEHAAEKYGRRMRAFPQLTFHVANLFFWAGRNKLCHPRLKRGPDLLIEFSRMPYGALPAGRNIPDPAEQPFRPGPIGLAAPQRRGNPINLLAPCTGQLFPLPGMRVPVQAWSDRASARRGPGPRTHLCGLSRQAG